MTLFDNLKNKLFKEETSGKGKESQPAGKSKDLQDRIKGLFAKKPDEVEQAVDLGSRVGSDSRLLSLLYR